MVLLVGGRQITMYRAGGVNLSNACTFYFNFSNERSTSLQMIIINHIESAILRCIHLDIYRLTHKMLQLLCCWLALAVVVYFFSARMSGTKPK